MNDMLQEQMSVLDELERTQSIIIDALLNRLIEDRADIMDVLTIDDFFSKTLIITQRSESEILDLTPQVKERVIEQRTLEARYRQLLIDYEAGLTDLINRFSNLKERIASQDTRKTDSYPETECPTSCYDAGWRSDCRDLGSRYLRKGHRKVRRRERKSTRNYRRFES